MQQNSGLAAYQSNRWATRYQRQQRGTINLDEAFAEQWQENYG